MLGWLRSSERLPLINGCLWAHWGAGAECNHHGCGAQLKAEFILN